ncbi:MAG: bifunctional diguanylate cyclase/phosphodiesterase [Thermoleophilia bacterium]|nr:bifunctional diguanylate cyclase/phosphodiesterase [Thermoleophilia bacterium]
MRIGLPLRRRAPDRQPRLVLRFALIVGVCLSVAAVTIVVATRYLNQQEAEKNAATHARFVGRSLLAPTLKPTDFTAPLTEERKAALDQFFSSRVLIGGTSLILLVGEEGIAYATDGGLAVGSNPDPARVTGALGGDITSSTGTIADPNANKKTKVLETYVGVNGGTAVFYQDYGPIAAAAQAAFLPIAGTLELAVLLLFALLVPILSRVTRHMRQQMEQIDHQAHHDDLTGLPNRLHFRKAIEQHFRDQPSAAIMMIDLDGFKDVNDTLGHDVGDKLLQEVPERLHAALPAGAALARLGGDEFAVMLPNATAEEALATGVAIRRRLERPFQFDHLSLAVDASIGIAEAPRHGADAYTVLKNADVAMYVAKETRSGCAIYDPVRDTLDPERLRLLADLRGALERGEISPHYQPKLALATDRIQGVEALARWEHPALGMITPDRWIPLVEQAGYHELLLRRMIETTLEQLAVWDRLGIRLAASINLSMHDLFDIRLPELIDGLIGSSEISPQSITFEITESAFMANPTRVRRVLAGIADLGCRISIDDYGTGYSSLTYLRSLPVDELKIDRSFVKDIHDEPTNVQIVRSTIDLAHSLGLTVVAEGIEQPEELEVLRNLGCDMIQGYIIGRPRKPAALTARLLAGRRHEVMVPIALVPAEPPTNDHSQVLRSRSDGHPDILRAAPTSSSTERAERRATPRLPLTPTPARGHSRVS